MFYFLNYSTVFYDFVKREETCCYNRRIVGQKILKIKKKPINKTDLTKNISYTIGATQVARGCIGYHCCTTLFNKVRTKVLWRFNPGSRCCLRYWEPLALSLVEFQAWYTFLGLAYHKSDSSSLPSSLSSDFTKQ